jgi:hypothetical protein
MPYSKGRIPQGIWDFDGAFFVQESIIENLPRPLFAKEGNLVENLP